MEVYQDIALNGAMNIYKADWETPFEAVTYSNYLALFFVILAGLVPIVLMLLYCCKIKKLKD